MTLSPISGFKIIISEGDLLKSVIITGGSRGIGAAAVRLFSSRGWDVYFLYHSSADKAESLARETGACAVCADVADAAAVERAYEIFRQHHSAPSAIVNNAAISQVGLFQDMTEDEWQRLMSVNVTGVYNCIHRALPDMLRAGEGSIVNISSMWGVTGASCEVAYSASKAAVIGLTKALAKEVGPSGIRVNCVTPGVIETDMNAHLDEAAKAELAEQTPLGRIGSPEEVASLIYCLCSEDASFITGQVIGVDGGFAV